MKATSNVVRITGGATGIGLALAEAFLREGNEVIICGRRRGKLAEATLKALAGDELEIAVGQAAHLRAGSRSDFEKTFRMLNSR